MDIRERKAYVGYFVGPRPVTIVKGLSKKQSTYSIVYSTNHLVGLIKEYLTTGQERLAINQAI